MAAITKSQGTTPSERFLARLADHSFLSLWAYPNVFRDVGKELCDLLVVCGNKVIVFSDKSIEWPLGVPPKVAWGRWYRRAIGHSAHQLKRAIGWIRNHPDRIFLDAACKHRFPINLPRLEDLELYCVIVARGASDACKHFFQSGSGSLALSPLDSSTTRKSEVPPDLFFVGNPSPLLNQVFHIVDDVSLAVLLLELDTITDLTHYLQKKEALILRDQLAGAHGEEDLLALYLKDINADGEHDFVDRTGVSLAPNVKIMIEGGTYEHYRNRREYKRKKLADKVSYFWDNLIERFAKHIIDDISYIPQGFEELHKPTNSELALRHMALVSRLERRSHALAIKGAFENFTHGDRFFRAMLPGPTSSDQSTGFFFLLLKRHETLSSFSDDEYRQFRSVIMHAYAMNMLRLMPALQRVVGISTEGELGLALRSEDLIYAEQPEWTKDYADEVAEAARKLGIFKDGLRTNTNQFRLRPREYPPSHYPSARGANPIPYDYVPEYRDMDLNRATRRARRAQARKGKR